MREWSLDLHVHSILSPCAGEEMIPAPVLIQAKALGLQAFALTDHNSAENTAAFVNKGKELGITVIPGMELQTIEDIHLICLFDDLSQAQEWQDFVCGHLPPIKNKRDFFGEQWVVDAEGNKIREVDRLLLIGTDLALEEAVDQVHAYEGICLAAHVDRQAFSLWGHLSCIPDDLPIDGVELSLHSCKNTQLLNCLKQRKMNPVISSDAHYLNDLVSARCYAWVEKITVGELRLALAGIDGRYIRSIY